MSVWRGRHRASPPAALAEECAAVLAGRYAEELEVRSMPVPLWAWLNLLAHGTEDELREASTDLDAPGCWTQARAFLAGEVLDAVELRGRPLATLQREVLVPLELELAGSTAPSTDRWSSSRLVAHVLAALDPWTARSRR